ncbi:MAG: TVP38/TMEM64 family protein [Caldilineaceae bacterium]
MTVQTSDSLETAPPSFWGKHGQKLVAAAFWVLLVGGYTWYYQANHLTTETALLQLVDLFRSAWGPLLYILLYALRPLIFFPATLLTLTSGAIFGAGSLLNLALAVLYTAIGANASAMVAYLVGHFFGQGLLQEQKREEGTAGLLQRYTERMRQNSFETVLIMRFIFLPYDLVNYLAGILRIDWKAFLLATILGSIPGTIAFVSFGASIDIKELAMGKTPEVNPWVLGFGLVILLVSIAISRYFKKRETASA